MCNYPLFLLRFPDNSIIHFFITIKTIFMKTSISTIRGAIAFMATLFLTFFTLSLIGQDLLEDTRNGVSLENNAVPNRIAEWLNEKANQSDFQVFELFEIATEIQEDKYNGVVKEAIYLVPQKGALSKLINESPQNLRLSIPVSKGTTFELELAQASNLSDNFTAVTSSEKILTNQDVGGIFYRGIVKDRPNSIVALSVFPDHIRMLISDEGGNYVLAELRDEKEQVYVLYNDKLLLEAPSWECGVDDETEVTEMNIEKDKSGLTKSSASKCMNIYVEADSAVFAFHNFDVVATAQYVQSLFNESATIFQNEDISMALEQVFIWTETDPFVNLGTSAFLDSFGKSKQATGFPGNLAHAISLRVQGSGIAAAINGICSDPFAFSGLFADLQGFPMYSWDLNVFTHEMGHVLGSFHTHGCYWNSETYGVGTQIDDCASLRGNPEGAACFDPENPIIPVNGGTIMSYCHQVREIGMNFSLGFGEQPGDIIRFVYNNPGAGCSTDCEPQPNLICNTSGQAVLENGQVILPEMSVINIGDTPSNPTDVGFYISPDERIIGTAPPFGAIFNPVDFFIGEQAIGSVNTVGGTTFSPTGVTLEVDSLPTNLFSGDYFVGAYPDYTNKVNESNKGDNGCPLGDPVFRLDANLVCGGFDQVTFVDDTLVIQNFIVRNDGPYATNFNTLGVFISTDSIFSIQEDIYLGGPFVRPLLAGQADTFNFVIPQFFDSFEIAIAPGEYIFGLVIDVFDDVVESNEEDNVVCAYNTISIVEDNRFCSGQQFFDAPSGSFTDGSGESNYLNYTECIYVIDPPGDDPIKLTFDEFDVEQGFDFVYVLDGNSFDAPLIASLTGSSIPDQVIATSGSMIVAFISDEIFTNGGWSANYEVVIPTDLELSIASSNPDLGRYESAIYTFEVTNTSSNPATGIVVQQDMAGRKLTLVGGTMPEVSKGEYNRFTSTWTIDLLAPGETATVSIELFSLSNDFDLFAQVMAVDQDDVDSSPGNGVCCTANEDDEAVFRPNSAAVGRGLSNSAVADADVNFTIEAIYPNPVTNEANVTFYSNLEEVTYTIQDVNGKVVSSDIWDTAQGMNTKTIDLSQLSEGIYFLQVDNGTPQRIVKLR